MNNYIIISYTYTLHALVYSHILPYFILIKKKCLYVIQFQENQNYLHRILFDFCYKSEGFINNTKFSFFQCMNFFCSSKIVTESFLRWDFCSKGIFLKYTISQIFCKSHGLRLIAHLNWKWNLILFAQVLFL